MNHASAHGRDLVQNDTAPHVALLHIVEPFISTGYEVDDGFDVTHLTMLSPVAGQLQFRQLGVGVLPVAEVVNDEGHVSAVLSEETQALEVGFNHRARSGYSEALLI